MDLYVTDPELYDESHHTTTTSHNDEPFDDVMNIAELSFAENENNEIGTIQH